MYRKNEIQNDVVRIFELMERINEQNFSLYLCNFASILFLCDKDHSHYSYLMTHCFRLLFFACYLNHHHF